MKKVLVLDSGSGGVNMLKSFTHAGIGANFLMFCDQKNLPYGSKTAEQLQKITIENLQNIRSFFQFDIVVLACNTLSCTVLGECRKAFAEVIFIGTEPAVLPATKAHEAKDVLVLGTEVTLTHNKLIQQTPGLQLLPLPSLATLIDENLDDLNVLEPFLREKLQDVHAEAVVLGCTHYVALKKTIQKITGAEIFDSAEGVTHRLASFVQDNSESQVQIVLSDSTEKLPLFWWHYMNNNQF